MPLGQWATDSAPTSVMGWAALLSLTCLAVTDLVGSALSSTMVFQDSHSPHWPTHLMLVQPHSVQRKLLATLAMAPA
jgi:hypothetical protein